VSAVPEVDDALGVLARHAALVAPPSLPELLERLRTLVGAAWVRLSLPSGEQLVTVGADSQVAPDHREETLPLRIGTADATWTLTLMLPEARTVDGAEADAVAALIGLLRVTILQQQQREEGPRQLNETRLLLELARTTAGTLDMASILNVACDFLVRLLDVTGVVIYQYDYREGLLVGAAASDALREGVEQIAVPIDDPGITATSARELRPIWIEDTDAERERLNPALLARFGGRAAFVLPLVNREELFGVVCLLDARGPRHFTTQQQELATATVGQLALSIANARLYESLWNSYADLAAARAEMVKRERLAALGELAAIVAHEVRNPLGVIFNAVSSLRRAGVAEGDAGMLVDILAEESDRLNRIVGDLLDFSRPRALDLETCDVESLIEEALDVARASVSEHARAVTFEVELGEGLQPLSVDRRLFRQALVNVLLNALQAMPLGGTVTLRARVETGASARGLLLEVCDHGAGIAPELRARIFEPFFTTKARGTGLGLAVVKRIVEDHRGEVFLDSRLGVGTTFTFRLPWAAPPSQQPQPLR